MDHNSEPLPPLLGILVTVFLACTSGFLGFLEHATAVANFVSKLVAIGAGLGSIILVYKQLKKEAE